jgi:hypothetical protein
MRTDETSSARYECMHPTYDSGRAGNPKLAPNGEAPVPSRACAKPRPLKMGGFASCVSSPA